MCEGLSTWIISQVDLYRYRLIHTYLSIGLKNNFLLINCIDQYWVTNKKIRVRYEINLLALA